MNVPAPGAVAAPAADAIDEFTVEESRLAELRAARARRLHTEQVPTVRAIGFAMLCLLAITLDLLAGTPNMGLAWVVIGNLAYAALSWLLLRATYGRTGAIDLSLVLFHVDLVVWLANVHHLEQAHLFVAFLLLARVVDQIGFGVRRALYFAHVVPLLYLAYSLAVALHSPERALWSDRLGIALMMYLQGIYAAFAGQLIERLRHRTRRAVHAARELVANLGRNADELKAQARELKQAQQAAEQASVAKSRFLAVTSHELRTPMNGILGALELLKRSELGPSQKRYLDIAERSALGLLGLIDDVLDLSRIDAGRIELNPARVDLRALATQTVDTVARLARDKQVRLEVSIDPALPARMLVDPVRLQQVLSNLLRNAVKFTEQGSVRLEVAVVERLPHGLRVRFSVRDTGIGIREDQFDSIFGAFTQGDDSTTRRYGGTGLGLSIVKHLAEAMGGTVHVQSHVGQGSHFWVDLPLQQAPDGDTPETPPAAPQTGRTLRVLLAEKDSADQLIARELLESLGCAVDTVEHGEAAFRAAEERRYDLVLIDVELPVLDGFDATRRIRDSERMLGVRTPIVALCRGASPALRLRCLASGIDDFLERPLTRERLAEIVQRWTGRQRFA